MFYYHFAKKHKIYILNFQKKMRQGSPRQGYLHKFFTGSKFVCLGVPFTWNQLLSCSEFCVKRGKILNGTVWMQGAIIQCQVNLAIVYASLYIQGGDGRILCLLRWILWLMFGSLWLLFMLNLSPATRIRNDNLVNPDFFLVGFEPL